MRVEIKMGTRSEIAAKAAKRNEIMRKMNEVYSKLREAQDIMASLNSCKTNIQNEVECWNNEYHSFQRTAINADVVVEDVFEGTIAELLSREIPEKAERMERTCRQMNWLCREISVQLNQLRAYVEELQAQIQALHVELASL